MNNQRGHTQRGRTRRKEKGEHKERERENKEKERERRNSLGKDRQKGRQIAEEVEIERAIE